MARYARLVPATRVVTRVRSRGGVAEARCSTPDGAVTPPRSRPPGAALPRDAWRPHQTCSGLLICTRHYSERDFRLR
ncbi:hypothetical protein E2C01_058016 [Portunus trituberculatus]|uniref:Uncharacterized protein n=1 Tax=Portunus trituberculatus TaxID=210409 RepID=A0A5B7H462_PORTR|nr:hypothetical protein [Portunus trituberculatus]